MRAARIAALAGLFGAAMYYCAGAGAERIAVTAAKFEFSEKVIHARKGKPLTLVLKAADFPHGFAVPDFNARIDLVPGRTVELTFTPDRAGRFVFLCDNFCGEGHDRMTGFLVVTED